MSTTFLERSEWTDEAKGFPNWPERLIDPDDVWGNVLHYPAAGDRKFEGMTLDETAEWLNIWRNYHVDGRGWADIGYPVAADQAGNLWDAAGDEYGAAHSATPTFGDANQQLMAILLILGDNEKPSKAMIRAVNDQIARWEKKFPNMRLILGHQEVPGASTRCPGPQAMRLLNADAFGLERPGPYAVSPVVGRVTSEWGWRTHPKTKTRNHHNGIDLAPPRPGQKGVEFFAMFGGTVRSVRNGGGKTGNAITGDRNTGSHILIDGLGGGSEWYGHHAGKAFVKEGDVVHAGQPLGIIGAVGNVTGEHVHLEIWGGRTPDTAYDPRIAFKQLGLVPGQAGETVARSVVGTKIKVQVARPKHDGAWDANGKDSDGAFREGRPPGLPQDFTLLADGVAGYFQWYTLQKHLWDEGYYDVGPNREYWDGKRGKHTVRAFQEFLWDEGYRHHARDGVWGPATSRSAQEWLISVGEKFHKVDDDWGWFSNLSLQHALLDDDIRN